MIRNKYKYLWESSTNCYNIQYKYGSAFDSMVH